MTAPAGRRHHRRSSRAVTRIGNRGHDVAAAMSRVSVRVAVVVVTTRRLTDRAAHGGRTDGGGNGRRRSYAYDVRHGRYRRIETSLRGWSTISVGWITSGHQIIEFNHLALTC